MATLAPGEAYRPQLTPFAGWTRDSKGRLVPLESAPHVGGFAPPGTGKTRRWLAQSAVLWPGPAFVSSSKDDLMQMVASRRAGLIALLDLRPITRKPCPLRDQSASENSPRFSVRVGAFAAPLAMTQKRTGAPVAST